MGGLLGGTYDVVAGVGDYAAGSLDESIGRQFDDEPGGGFGDYAVGGTADAVFEDPDEGMAFWFPGYAGESDDDTAGDSIDLWGPTFSEGANAAGGYVAETASNASKAVTPDWMNWLVENPVVTLGAVAALYLFVRAGGISESAEAFGGGS